MIVVISPAKTLDFESFCPIQEKQTQPEFLETTHKLVQEAQKLRPHQLEELMKISPKLAELNFSRFQAMKNTSVLSPRPCAYAFKGDTYQGLEFEKLRPTEQNYAQKHLRILSGLYGLLKPYDGIHPYRLEMGTPFKTKLGKNLYEVWKDKVTEKLDNELARQDILVNCASVEYFSAIDTNKLKAQVVTPIFMENKNGKTKVISFNAKRARGMMAKYIIQNKIKDINELKKFDLAGYAFQEASSNEKELIFIRG